MRNNKYHNFIQVLITLLVTASIIVGCTKENSVECIVLEIEAVINVNGVNQAVGVDDIQEIMFYVFDENDNFIAMESAEIGSTVTLYYPDHDKLSLVCWGNLAGGDQKLPILEVGTKLDDASVSLLTLDAKTTQGIVTIHPNSLFHTITELTLANHANTTVEMVIYPKTTPVKIVSEGLKERFGLADEEIIYVLRSGKKNVNFRGVINGDDVSHIQNAKFIDGTHQSPVFNILPDVDKNITVDIYKETVSDANLLSTIEQHIDGATIKAIAGDTLTIKSVYVPLEGGSIGITVKAETIELGQLVDEVALYVFNTQTGEFLDEYHGKVGSEMALNYFTNSSKLEKLTVICWGNADNNERQLMPELEQEKTYDLSTLMISAVRNVNGNYVDKTPDGLFHATVELTKSNQNSHIDMIIKPKVASLHINVAGVTDSDLINYVVKSGGKKRMYFDTGNVVPLTAIYYVRHATYIDSENAKNASVIGTFDDTFNILPAGAGKRLAIDVYNGETLIGEITKLPKEVNQGEQVEVNVAVSSDGTIDVEVEVVPWVEEEADKDF